MALKNISWLIAVLLFVLQGDSFAKSTGQRVNVVAKIEPLSKQSTIMLGEPLHLKMKIFNKDSKPERIGINGSMLSRASWSLEVSRDGEHYEGVELNELVDRRSPSLTILEIPPSAHHECIVTIWFAARRPGAVAGARPLVFDQPGKWAIRVIFYNVTLNPAGVGAAAGKSQVIDLSTDPIPIVVNEPADPKVGAFIEDIGRVIMDRHFVPAAHRLSLEQWMKTDAVKPWAQWLLMRSYLADEEVWWEALEARDPKAQEQLENILKIASNFEKGDPSPPRSEALGLMALDRAFKRQAEEARALAIKSLEMCGEPASERLKSLTKQREQ